MKKYPIDETLAHIRQMPESLRLDEVLTMAAVAPVAIGTGLGVANLIAKFLHVKYLIPMFFTSTTAGLALWYGLQIASPATTNENSTSGLMPKENPDQKALIINRENPLNSESLRLDTTKKKKKIIREERRIMTREGKEADAPLPPLPELPALSPSAPSQPEGSEVHEERRVIKRIKKGKDGVEKEDKDAFTDALVDYLQKEGLLKNREKFTLSLTPQALVVDGNTASAKQLKGAVDLFEKKEKSKFGNGSNISITRDKEQWSVSKSIESD